MIKLQRRFPFRGGLVVARFASRRRAHALRVFPALSADILKCPGVARDAIDRECRVIDIGGNPPCHLVAGVARLYRRDVSYRVLSGRQCAVMTLRAGRAGLRMVELEGLPPLAREFGMACLALVTR